MNNHIPAKGRDQSPLELFSSTTTKLPVKQFYHFGCPVYVLDSNLQANKRAGSKWRQRTRLGVNLGFSPQHAKSVHLVLSLQSGCVSPQFHCTFDNNFETLKEYNLPESQWQVKAHFINQRKTKGKTEDARDPDIPGVSSTQQLEVESNLTKEQYNDLEAAAEGTPESEIEPPLQSATDEPPSTSHEGAEVRRSGRMRRPLSRYKDYVTNDQELTQAIQASMTTFMKTEETPECIAFEALHVPTEKRDYYAQNPIATAMKSVADPDTFYLWEARKEDNFPKFLEAMQKEVDDHTREGHWKLVRRRDVLRGATILPAVWSLKRKRRISTREVYKWKARINIDGSTQIYGQHYDQTYSPVVAWPTTRFFLTQGRSQPKNFVVFRRSFVRLIGAEHS
jgi:hypothetical protein